jgi:acyl carrier protein
VEEKIKQVMSEIFVCSIDEIKTTTKKEDLKNWDSLQHIIFMAKLEKIFDVNFNTEEINEATTYSRIIDLLKTKNNS